MVRATTRLEHSAEALTRGEALGKIDDSLGQSFADAVAQVATDLDGVRTLIAPGGG